MRSTKKSDKFVNTYEWNSELPTKTFVQLGMNKLGQLEDIEEEYEIDGLQDLKERLEAYKFLANHKMSCVDVEAYNLMLNDLNEYHMIEKELGIDLITLFKAFKNGVYVKEIDRMTTVWKLVNDDGGTCLGAWHNDFEKEHNTIFLHLKDYGTIWALTKKELL